MLTQRLLPILIIFLFLFLGTRNPETSRHYFNAPFILSSVDSIVKDYVAFDDTIPNDTLYICFSKGNPLAVYREITTGVCLDGECRPVHIRLYWTLTGRYLGYYLKKQELTKKEHTPFTESEYNLLHSLLGDSLSVLANFTLEEIQPKKIQHIKTDGITGATPPNISGYIVPEAAFTTHTLWHLVYGETVDSLNLRIRSYLNYQILDSLLKSRNGFDQEWALRRIAGNEYAKSLFLPAVVQILSVPESRTLESALSFLENYGGSDSVYQATLLNLSLNEHFPVRRAALNRMKMLKHLHSWTAETMIALLPSAGSTVVIDYLLVIENSYHCTNADLKKICSLLEFPDPLISFNAYTFLVKQSAKKRWLISRLKKFEREKRH